VATLVVVGAAGHRGSARHLGRLRDRRIASSPEPAAAVWSLGSAGGAVTIEIPRLLG